MSKKSLLKIVTLLVLISMVLSGCAAPTPMVVEQTVEVKVVETKEVVKEVQVEVTPTPGPAEPVELVIWGEGTTAGQLELDPGTDPKAVYAHMLVEQFQEENPGITVKFENHGWDEELRQNLTNAMSGRFRS